MNLLRYLAVYVIAALAVMLALWGISLTGLQIPGSGLSVIPVFVAAMNEGQSYAKTHRTAPEKAAAWRFAFKAMLISLIPQAIVGALFYLFVPNVADALTYAGESNMIWGIVLLVVFVCGITVITNRLFLSIGARNVLKAANTGSR